MSDHKAEHTWVLKHLGAPARGGPHLQLFPELYPAPHVSAHNQKCVHPQLGMLRFKRPGGPCPNPISNNNNPITLATRILSASTEVSGSPGDRAPLQEPDPPTCPRGMTEGWPPTPAIKQEGGTNCLKHDFPNIPSGPRQDFLPLTLNTNITRY